MDRHKVVVEYSAQTAPYASQARKLRTEIEALNAAIVKSRVVSSEAFGGITKDYNDNLRAMKMWSSEAIAMDTQAARLGKSIERNQLTMQRQKQLLKEYRQGAVGARGAISELAKEQVRMSRSVVNFYEGPGGKRMAQVSTPKGIDFRQQATQIAVARQEMGVYNRLLAQNAEATINWGKNTQWAGRQIMVGLTIPLLMMGAAAKNVFIDIDKELTRLGKVYGGDIQGVTDDVVADIKNKVSGLGKELAAEWGVSMKETVGLAADVAATGKEGNDLLVATREAMRLSVLGEVDRQEAMKATLSLQNAFKLSNTELVDSVNLLNAVENQTSTSLEDLSTAIPKAGPVVKALGGDVGDLAAMLVAMKEGGIEAAEGANAIKSGLASMINPTKQASEMAKGFGIDLQGIVDNNQGKLMPTMLEFQKALMRLDEFKRAKLIETIFGKYQFARISALFENLNQEGSQSVEVFKLMGGSAAQLAQTADTEMKRLTESTSMRWQRTVESFKANLAPLGEAITKVFTGVLNAVNVVLDLFEKLPAPVKSFIGLLGGVAALVGPILMIAGIFGNFIGQMKKGFAILMGKKFGVFDMLTADMVAANAATNDLVESQFNEQKALMEVNSVMEKQIALLKELAAGQTLAAEAAQRAATMPPPVPPAGTGAARSFPTAYDVNYGRAMGERAGDGIGGAWLSKDQGRAQGYMQSIADSNRVGAQMSRIITPEVAPVVNEVGRAASAVIAEQVAKNGVIDPRALDDELRSRFPTGQGRDVARAVAGSIYGGLEVPMADLPDDIRRDLEKTPLVNRKGFGSVMREAIVGAVAAGVTPSKLPGNYDMGHLTAHGNTGNGAVTSRFQIPQSSEINREVNKRDLTPQEIATAIGVGPEVFAASAYAAQQAAEKGGYGKDKSSSMLESASKAKNSALSSYVSGLGDQAKAEFEKFRVAFGEGRISIQELQNELAKLASTAQISTESVAASVAEESKVTAARRAAVEADNAVIAAEAKLREARKAQISANNMQPGQERAWAQAAAKQQVEAAKMDLDAAKQNVRNAGVDRATAERNARASATQDKAATTQQRASQVNERAAQTEAATASSGGALSNFARSASGQTMGLGMGAMGVGMLTGNSDALALGGALSTVSMVAMGLESMAGPLQAAGAKLKAFGPAAAGAMNSAGGLKGALGKAAPALLGLVGPTGLATAGLVAVGGAAFLAYKLWKNAKEKQEAEGRANKVKTDFTGIQLQDPNRFSDQRKVLKPDEYTQFKSTWDQNKQFQQSVSDIKKMADLDAKIMWMQRSYEQDLNQINSAAGLTAEERKKRIENLQKIYELMADETGLAQQWAERDAKSLKQRVEDSVDNAKAEFEARKRQNFLNSPPGTTVDTSQLQGGLLDQYPNLKPLAEAADLKAIAKQASGDIAQMFKVSLLSAPADARGALLSLQEPLKQFGVLAEMNLSDFESMKKAMTEGAPEFLRDELSKAKDMDEWVTILADGLGAIPKDVQIRLGIDNAEEVMMYLTAMQQIDAQVASVRAELSKPIKDPFDEEKVSAGYDRRIEAMEEAGKAAEKAHRRQQEISQDAQDDLKDEIDLKQEEIDKIDKTIEKINDKAEADKKALEKAKELGDFNREQQKSDIAYYDALARGDYVGAADIRAQMEQASADQQYSQTTDAIDAKADKETAKQQKKIDAINASIKGLQDEIDAIGKVQEANDRAFQHAQEKRQEALEDMRKNKEAFVAAERAKSAAATKAANDARKAMLKRFDDETATTKKLAANSKLTMDQIVSRVNTSAAAISKAMGWTPAETKKFSTDMTNSLLTAYANAIAAADISPGEYKKLTKPKGSSTKGSTRSDGSKVVLPEDYGFTTNHTGTFVERDHTTGRNGARGDEVDRRLQVGEYVVRKEAVRKYGKRHFDDLNRMKMHSGGPVKQGPLRPFGQAGMGLVRSKVKDLITDSAMEKVFKPKIAQLVAQKGATGGAPITPGLAAGGTYAPGNYGPPNMSGPAQNTAAAAAYARRRWGITVGTWRPPGGIPGDHPYGKAMDAMTSDITKGTEIANYFLNNPKEFGTKYVIWRQRINNLQNGGGWRAMADRGSPTQNHMDHVHVSFLKKGAQILKDGGLQSLHKGETVLTAPLSESLKQGINGLHRIPDTIGSNGSGMVVNESNSDVNINVYAAPGMDVEQLADAIAARQERAALRVGVAG